MRDDAHKVTQDSGVAVPKRTLERLSEARVLCVGDLMLDQYVHGDVERVSPEAPIPVLRVRETRESLGGVGTVVRNLASLACDVHLVAPVGNDAAADRLRNLLDSYACVQATVIASDRPTTVKRRYVAAGQQILRADTEENHSIDAAVAASLFAIVEEKMQTPSVIDVVVISDYAKGALTDALIGRIIATARACGKEVIVDPKGDNYHRYSGAHWVTPNRGELHRATRLAVDTDADIARAATHVGQSCGIDTVLATRSAEGMSLVRVIPKSAEPDVDPEVTHFAAEAHEVFDVSGAGDTVVAWLAAARAVGVSHQDAARLANTAAGIVVAKVGAAVVYVGEVERALLGGARVRSREELVTQVLQWRARGQRIGITNGCFDLIHPGHVALLEEAKTKCDRLIVALNSDASVRRLKGPTRPVQNEASRAVVLAAFDAVDAVCIFHEDTPYNLIEAIGPDVLIKGADWNRKDVVGAELVEARGGEVVLVDLVDGHSTSALLRDI